ncbi:MAG: ATP-binding cassette domain-containing protein, partial [Solitalea sp.]
YASSLNALWAGNGSEFISSLFKVLLLWAGAAFVLEREMTPGELLSFFTLLNYFTAPVARLVEMNQTLQDALIAAGRLFEIMDLEPDSVSRQAQFSPEKAGPICFNNITFRYGTRSPVFRGLTLRIPEGEITALVGESGSGKSTLSSLLLGIYAPESGTITINGMNIRHVDPQRLRRIVGIVPQQIHLLPGSLLENIAMGEYAPDMERVLYACKGAGMMDFLETLPLGLHTGIGEGGTRLSGGQRQRVAIARVLYRNPQVLVLDEATASLDAVAESRIQNTFFSLRDKGKTILIITHRLPAI